jgi:rod shape-determining protein MreD
VLRLLRTLLVFYVLIVLQTTLGGAIGVQGIRPDFLLIAVLLIALHEGAAGGAVAGFVAGLFVDLNSVNTLGITSLANGLVGFATGTIADRLVRTSWITRCALAFAATALRDQLVVTFAMSGGVAEAIRFFFRSALAAGLYTALVAPLLMALIERTIGWEREAPRGFR